MFEKFSNLAKDAIKAGTEMAKANPDKILDMIKAGAEIAANNGNQDKGILERGQEVLKEKGAILIQEALNKISPLKIDFDGSIAQKSIVIHEESLNNYMKEKISNIPGLEAINIKIFDNNLLVISGEASKSMLKISFSQKLKLEQFKINNEEGFAEFTIIGEPDIKAKGFINQVLLFITRSILKSVVNKNLIEVMNENNIQVKGDKLFIDLKHGPAKQLYSRDINTILSKDIPLIGNKKVIDLIAIKEVITKDKTIIIGLGF